MQNTVIGGLRGEVGQCWDATSRGAIREKNVRWKSIDIIIFLFSDYVFFFFVATNAHACVCVCVGISATIMP